MNNTCDNLLIKSIFVIVIIPNYNNLVPYILSAKLTVPCSAEPSGRVTNSVYSPFFFRISFTVLINCKFFCICRFIIICKEFRALFHSCNFCEVNSLCNELYALCHLLRTKNIISISKIGNVIIIRICTVKVKLSSSLYNPKIVPFSIVACEIKYNDQKARASIIYIIRKSYPSVLLPVKSSIMTKKQGRQLSRSFYYPLLFLSVLI